MPLRLNTERIKIEMARQGITVPDIAYKLDLTPNAIYAALKERPITQAERFAKILHMDPKDLIIHEPNGD